MPTPALTGSSLVSAPRLSVADIAVFIASLVAGSKPWRLGDGAVADAGESADEVQRDGKSIGCASAVCLRLRRARAGRPARPAYRRAAHEGVVPRWPRTQRRRPREVLRGRSSEAEALMATDFTDLG